MYLSKYIDSGIFDRIIEFCFILHSNGKTFQAVNVFCVALVQLAEYFMWKDIKCETNVYKFGNLLGTIHYILIAFMVYIAIKYIKRTFTMGML